MQVTMRDDTQVSLSCLFLPPIFAFIFSVLALGGAFSVAYTFPSTMFQCPVLFLSNIASMHFGRMFVTYFSSIAAFLMGIAIFLQFVDIKLRLKWVNTENEIGKYLFMNKLSLFCGIVSMLGLIGVVSFPFEGMPVIQALYPMYNSSNITEFIQFNFAVAVNMLHLFNVGMFYVGFFLFAWLVFFLNIRTRSIFPTCSRVYLIYTQFILLLLLTIFLISTVISMILMTVYYEVQPDTRNNVRNLCWKEYSVGYHSHTVAIASQYIVTLGLFLFGLTLIPPLRRRRVNIAIEHPHHYSLDSELTQEDPPPSQHSTNECKQVSATRRDTLSESSDILYGNHIVNSQSNSVFDLFRETNL